MPRGRPPGRPRKTAARKTAARKTAARKTAARGTTARKAATRKTAARRTPVARERRIVEISAPVVPPTEPRQQVRQEEVPQARPGEEVPPEEEDYKATSRPEPER